MTVYVSETPDDDLRIVREGEDVRHTLSGRTVTVDATTPNWYRRIAQDNGYDVMDSSVDATTSSTPAPEVSSD